MKILRKLRKFYPEETEKYKEIMGEETWKNQIKEYCPLMEDMNINLEDMNLIKKRQKGYKNRENKRIRKPTEKLTQIEEMYINKLHEIADPN